MQVVDTEPHRFWLRVVLRVKPNAECSNESHCLFFREVLANKMLARAFRRATEGCLFFTAP